MPEKSPEQVQKETIRLALESIEKLVVSGHMAEARTYLTELWPYITEGLNLTQKPSEVAVYSGIGLGYMTLGNRAQAQQFAMFALIVSPQDILAHAIAPISDRVLVVRHFMHHHQLRKAIDLLHAIELYTPAASAEVNFYLSVLSHFENEKARVRLLTPLSDGATLLNLVLWGEAYVEKFLRYALPSLLAPGNIPALAEAGRVVIDIYTTEADRDRLSASPRMRALSKIARIDYTIIPPEFFAFKGANGTVAHDRLFVSGIQSLSAMKAKALGADLTYVVTEGLYSDRHFSIAKDYLQTGYKAVLMSSLRARDSDLTAHLDMHGVVTENTIAIDAKPLVEYATKNINQQFGDLFIRRDPAVIGQDVIALYFKTAAGFTAHSYQISPALISHKIIPSDLEFDYHTSDTRLLSELAKDEDPSQIYKIIQNPAEELFVVDLESSSDGTARIFGKFPVTVEQCVNSALKWCNRETDFAYFEWAFQQKFEFQCDPGALPDSDFSETETVAAFLSLFEKSQENYVLNIRHYRGDYDLEP